MDTIKSYSCLLLMFCVTSGFVKTIELGQRGINVHTRECTNGVSTRGLTSLRATRVVCDGIKRSHLRGYRSRESQLTTTK